MSFGLQLRKVRDGKMSTLGCDLGRGSNSMPRMAHCVRAGRRRWGLLVAAWFVACCCGVCLLSRDVAAAPRKVLIVYSWHDQMPWQAGVRSGIAEHLQTAAVADRPELYEERIDASRIKDAAADVGLYNYLQAKYQRVALDVVVAESQSAANFLIRHPDLFPAAKRFAVNVADPGNIPPEQTFVVTEDPGRALKAILEVMPDRERIVVVLDRTGIAGNTKKGLVEAAAALSSRIPVEILEEFGFDELYARVGSLPPRSALLYFPVFHDRHGARRIPRDVASTLAEHANAPIFAHHDSFLGTGIVGGYLISAPRVGKLIALIALGSPLPQSLEEINSVIKDYQFDDRQLQRWEIPDARLPIPHTVFMRKPSAWILYRWQIVGVACLLALESLLIFVLLRSMRDRRRALADLAEEHASLERRVEERTIALKAANEQLALLSFSDGLTHLANRRRFDELLEAEFLRLRRSRAPLSLIILDIDFFKNFNDTYGHVVGDDCLRRVGAQIRGAVSRAPDLAARYGGEEFAIVLPETGAQGALALAEQIRAGIASLEIPHAASSVADHVTVSLGVVTVITRDMQSSTEVVALADEQLYLAKANGRNRVVAKAFG